MVTDDKGVPIMFRLLPGPVADMAVLRDLVNDMRRLDCRDERLVMDRGFESAANVRTLLDADIQFVMPSNARVEAVKKLVTRSVKGLKDSPSYRMHEGSPYKTVEYELGVIEHDSRCEYAIEADERYKEARKLTAFIVYGPKKTAEDIGGMMPAVADTEARLEGTRPRDSEKVYRELPAFVRRCVISYDVDEDGVMHIRRKQSAFTFADNRAGIFVMLAPKGTDWERIMSSYDIRDWVEKAFGVYKNDLDAGRTRTGVPRGREDDDSSSSWP